MGRISGITVSILFVTITLLACALPVIASIGITQATYHVISKGFRIGRVTTSQKAAVEEGATVIRFEKRTDVQASFLWFSYSNASCEKATIRDGKLVAYSRTEKANGKEIRVDGRLVGDSFRFEATENGKHRTVVIPCSSYDFTTMECPEATMAFAPNGEATLKILDPEYMTVVTRTYKLVRNDKYEVDDREYECRVVDLSDCNKSCRRWVGRDRDAVILFRQDGKGKEGSYSVRATAIGRT
jgi:hypothetical protein